MVKPETKFTWRPASVEEVRRIVEIELQSCCSAEAEIFKRHAIEPYFADLVRYGKRESAVVVARKQDSVLYWEDVEEGFVISPISSDGLVLEHNCNQDTLGQAIRGWLEDAR